MEISTREQLLFLEWIYAWHGSCAAVGTYKCEIRQELFRYEEGKSTLDKVIKVLDEVDDGWKESWALFKSEHIKP